jgi:hypothetical protein
MNHPHAADLELVTADDRAWFEAHPDREYRLRFSGQSEIWEVEHFGGPIPPAVHCVVTAVRQIRPGVRIRKYNCLLSLTGRPDEASETTAADLFHKRFLTVSP